METIIYGEALLKTYSTEKNEVRALNNVDISIRKGDFTIVMGPSGSGKSTLLHVLSSLDKPSEGKVVIGGKEIQKMNEKELSFLRRKEIGFIFQDFNLVPNLSVLENLLIAAYLVSSDKKRNIENAMNIIRRLGLDKLVDRFPSELSGGQQQRTAVARSLINNPEVIFADEPTGNLNSKSSRELLDILSELNEQGQTILMVTHDHKAACRGKQVLFLKDGKIEDIYNRPVISSSISEETLFQWLSSRGW